MSIKFPFSTGKIFFFTAGFLYVIFLAYAVHSVKAQESNDAQYDENGWKRVQLEDGTWAREKVTYFLPDHLGGTDVEVDEHGTIVARADYLPYGKDRVRLETESSDSHQFTGQEKDDETGFYYYGARYYDPAVGRFLGVDPWEGDLGDPQTLNKYAYVLNNPIVFVDPTGMYVMETGEVEEGDTLPSIGKELNEYFGTNFNVGDFAKFNNIKGGIEIGDTVLMGAYNDDGSVWQRAYNSSNVTIGYWNGLNDQQQMITHYGRNLFQTDLPPTLKALIESDIASMVENGYRGWTRMGRTSTHNLNGASNNLDMRGKKHNAGKQAIYDPDGNLVTSAENMGTFDFGVPLTEAHVIMDVLPWVRWGNSPQDTTTAQERNSAFKGIFDLFY